jgi:hypothetical protein
MFSISAGDWLPLLLLLQASLLSHAKLLLLQALLDPCFCLLPDLLFHFTPSTKVGLCV